MTMETTEPFFTSNPPKLYVNGRFYPGQMCGRLIDPPGPMRRGDGVLATNLLYFGFHGCVSACGMIIEWTQDGNPTVVLMLPDKPVGTSPINACEFLATSIAANILPDADPRTVSWHPASDLRYERGSDRGLFPDKRFDVFAPAVEWKRSLRTRNPIKLLTGGAWKWRASCSYGVDQEKQGNRERALALIEQYWPRIEHDYPANMSSAQQVLFRNVYGTPTPPA
jgi:hypothetical protein